MNNSTKKIREKAHRLPEDHYVGSVSVAFTVCTRGRVPFFVDPEIVDAFQRVLLEEAGRFECEILVYLFMPDHCHILLRGKSENARPLYCMRTFKQKTGFWLSRHRPTLRWQKDFYDHVIKDELEEVRHLRYILENPIRKHLVQDWKDYGAKGSTSGNLEEWLM